MGVSIQKSICQKSRTTFDRQRSLSAIRNKWIAREKSAIMFANSTFDLIRLWLSEALSTGLYWRAIANRTKSLCGTESSGSIDEAAKIVRFLSRS